ncbi:MAG: YdiU family protein, partial [Mariprofundaceae bacterium]
PRLGDGRAILLGELIDKDGIRHDIQLKGSGRTPFSRQGDGKAALGPVMREYIVSEAMAALGVPTTRALSIVSTGDQVYRETPLPGAVLTRVAQSHVRVGTFQYFYSQNNIEALKTLADYVIERHYPAAAEEENPYLALLDGVVERQAVLIAQWMSIGFIHGVMNTDNMQIAGETIDYGPCAFMDSFHPDTVFSFIDRNCRYAWGNQPAIGQWNLERLAEALMPIISDDQESAAQMIEESVNRFGLIFNERLMELFCLKMGLSREQDGSVKMVEETFTLMAENSIDFTLFFRQLTRVAGGEEPTEFLALFDDRKVVDRWLSVWKSHIGKSHAGKSGNDEDRVASMRRLNPIYIPRNHMVERVIERGIEGDFKPFHQMVDLLARPYDEQPEHSAFELPPQEDEIVKNTFCGT